MQTINADTHPIFRELHRPDPKRPPHMQDKRMVVILYEDDYLRWLSLAGRQLGLHASVSGRAVGGGGQAGAD